MLHLSPADFFFEIPTGTRLSSLALQYDGDPYSSMEGIEYNRLYSLFCITSLIYLRVDEWPRWGLALYQKSAVVKMDRAGTSNLQSLEFFKSNNPGPGLQKVLSWPKALKNFTFCTESFLSTNELQRCLKHQHQTLETLEIHSVHTTSGKQCIVATIRCMPGLTFCIGSDIWSSITLTDFSALKFLYIRVDYFVVASFDSNQDNLVWDPKAMPTHRLIKILPKTIEELRLDGTEMFYHYCRGDPEYESGLWDLLSWLAEVVASKPAALPSLEIVRYSPSHFYRSDTGRNDARYEEIERIYNEAKVDLQGHDKWIDVEKPNFA